MTESLYTKNEILIIIITVIIIIIIMVYVIRRTDIRYCFLCYITISSVL